MKHIFFIFLIIFSFNAFAKDDGLNLIQRRGYLRCGTDLSVKTLAKKDKEGLWQGIDTEICKVLATALLGSPSAFEMIDTKSYNLQKNLLMAQIDVAIGGHNIIASNEVSAKITPAATFYYDNLKFLAYKKENATSMLAYKDANVCTITGQGLNEFYIKEYSQKYNLNLNILKFNSKSSAKEAFLLKRCAMLADAEIYLKDIQKENTIILNDVIETVPINIYVVKQNYDLKIAIKWIVNALLLSEKMNISKSNLSISFLTKDKSTQNLLGDNPKIWQALGLKPDWLKLAISQVGNYDDFFNSFIAPLGIKREKNNLIENNGLMKAEPFL